MPPAIFAQSILETGPCFFNQASLTVILIFYASHHSKDDRLVLSDPVIGWDGGLTDFLVGLAWDHSPPNLSLPGSQDLQVWAAGARLRMYFWFFFRMYFWRHQRLLSPKVCYLYLAALGHGELTPCIWSLVLILLIAFENTSSSGDKLGLRAMAVLFHYKRSKLREGTEDGNTALYLSISNPKIWNPKCSKVQTFLSTDMMPQVENSTYDLMWWVTVKTQAQGCWGSAL
jgi:hypothetical protein